MIRRIVVSAGLLGVVAALGGCFSLNFDEDVRQINHYGKSLDEMRKMTNKFFWDYDQDNPFEE